MFKLYNAAVPDVASAEPTISEDELTRTDLEILEELKALLRESEA